MSVTPAYKCSHFDVNQSRNSLLDMQKHTIPPFLLILPDLTLILCFRCFGLTQPLLAPFHSLTHSHTHKESTSLVSAHPHHHWGRPPWEQKALMIPTHWLASGSLGQPIVTARRSASTCGQKQRKCLLFFINCLKKKKTYFSWTKQWKPASCAQHNTVSSDRWSQYIKR